MWLRGATLPIGVCADLAGGGGLSPSGAIAMPAATRSVFMPEPLREAQTGAFHSHPDREQ